MIQETRDNHPYIPHVLDDSGIYEPTDLQREVAGMMSAGATALKAARKTGVTKATIREWQKTSWFRKLQRQIAVETYLQSLQMACASMPDLVRRLQEIADSRNSKSSDVARAIAALSALADRAQSLVFEERSNDIQSAIADAQKSSGIGS